METKGFDYKGRKLVYRTKGSGPLVVLLHGFGEDGSIWRKQFDLFPKHQLVVPDLPGSGGSEAIDDMSIEGLAEAIFNLLLTVSVTAASPPAPLLTERGATSETLEAVDDSQKETGHYFKTGDETMWRTVKEYARMNRKNPTDGENRLWQNLRDNKLGVKVRRQHSIGGFIVDFAVLEIKLVIEVDGGYHDNADQQNLDRFREDTLKGYGYTILRFSNDQVTYNVSEVLQKLRSHIAQAKENNVLSETAPLSERRGAGGEAGAVTLIGHSMGGYIALAFAEKYPETLSAFGLFHSTAFADSEEKKETRRKGIAAMKEKGAEEFLKTFVPNLYAPATKEKSPELIEEHLASVGRVDSAAYVAYFEAMRDRPSRTEALRSADVLVLFVMGRHDKAVPVDDVLKQCHLPRLSSIHLLENSGHCGMVEESQGTNGILKQFIADVGNRT